MGTPVSLFIVALLCASLWPLSSQEVATDSPTPTAAATDAFVEAAGLSTDSITELQTVPPTAAATTDTKASVEVTTRLSLPKSTSEAILVPQASPAQEQATSLHTLGTSPEPETTTVRGLTTVAALEQTPPETTTIPPGTTEARLHEAQTTKNATSLSTVVLPTTTSPIIPPPLPTTPAIKQSSATPTSPQATTVDDTAEVTSVTLPIAPVTPLVFIPASPIIPVSYSETSSGGPADSTHGGSITPFAVGAPPSMDNNQSNMPIWVWIVIAALVAMLVGAVCITLLVQRKKKRADHGFGRASVNGRSQRSKKKMGEGDVWAGPVMMTSEGDDCEGKGGDGDVEGNGGLAEGTLPMLSSFAPSDEEKAVGAEGTKEVRRWSEQSPLLYIDEDAEEQQSPPKEQPPASSQDGGSAGKTEVEEAGQPEKGKVPEETGEVLNGAVAFCQTTAV
ncbi:hypothetical protein ACEWY4_002910 [Coilia grayii]|uniref:Uncharacterized protein n=1 Tax=Coilia grayii TaxID=363190 RepID=A0ABD1KPU2_9TELE